MILNGINFGQVILNTKTMSNSLLRFVRFAYGISLGQTTAVTPKTSLYDWDDTLHLYDVLEKLESDRRKMPILIHVCLGNPDIVLQSHEDMVSELETVIIAIERMQERVNFKCGIIIDMRWEIFDAEHLRSILEESVQTNLPLIVALDVTVTPRNLRGLTREMNSELAKKREDRALFDAFLFNASTIITGSYPQHTIDLIEGYLQCGIGKPFIVCGERLHCNYAKQILAAGADACILEKFSIWHPWRTRHLLEELLMDMSDHARMKVARV